MPSTGMHRCDHQFGHVNQPLSQCNCWCEAIFGTIKRSDSLLKLCNSVCLPDHSLVSGGLVAVELNAAHTSHVHDPVNQQIGCAIIFSQIQRYTKEWTESEQAEKRKQDGV